MGIPRVLLADDNPRMIELVTRHLGGEHEIVGTAANGEQLLKVARILDPDLIVLDISMPILNGIEVARHLGRNRSRAKLVFLTLHEDDDYLRAAVSAGALGYVLKSRLCTDLIPAIRMALLGQVFTSPPLRLG